MKTKLLTILLCFVLLFSFSACQPANLPPNQTENIDSGDQEGEKIDTSTTSTEPGVERYTHTGFYGFDTYASLIAYFPSEEEFNEFLAFTIDRLEHYHRLFTSFEAHEGIVNTYALNHRDKDLIQGIDSDLFELLEFSLEVAEKSEGAFNPALGQVIELWRKAADDSRNNPEKAYIPSKESLDDAFVHCDYAKIVLNQEDYSIEFLDSELKLDLGAIAKGYALELVMDELESEGYDNILISLGGNVKGLGTKGDGSPWKIGVQDPNKSGKVLESIEALNLAVVTSGIYERNFTVDEVLYHHIIDPVTLQPSDRYTSLTIICPDSGLADALATALFNMDVDQGDALANNYGASVIRVFPDKRVEHFSPDDFE